MTPDEADARAMLWCIRRGIHINYLVHFSGYSRSRVERLIRIGRALWGLDNAETEDAR